MDQQPPEYPTIAAAPPSDGDRPTSRQGGLGAVIATVVILVVGVGAALLVSRSNDTAGCDSPKSISVCSNEGSAAANTGATEITMGELAGYVQTIAASPEARAVFDTRYQNAVGEPVTVIDDAGDVDPVFEAKFLEERIYLTMVREEFERREYQATDEDRSASAVQIDSLLSPVDPTADPTAAPATGAPQGFPEEIYDLLVDDFTFIVAFGRIAEEARQVELQAAFAADPTAFVGTCVSHILISPVSDPTTGEVAPDADTAALAEAVAVKARLTAGEDFATVATEVSDDSSPGGELGCYGDEAMATTFVPEFAAPIPGLAVGVLSDPVKSDFGYHLILVTSRGPLNFDDALAQLEEAVPPSEPGLDEAVQELTLSGNVTVDPRFGTWDTAGEFGQLMPADSGTEPTASLVTP